jgi:hypothetical protein
MPNERIQLTDLDKTLAGPIDLFLCSASYETRCRSIPDNLDPKKVKLALVAENENHRDLHADQMEYLCSRFHPNARRIMLDTTNPLKTADSLSRALHAARLSSNSRVVIDATTFTHEGLLILFKLIRAGFKPQRANYLYTSAKEYSVGDPLETKWLSKGVGEIRSVLGYPGEFSPSRRLHLVALVGFEHDRVLELIRNYEPASISLGYATSDQPDSDEHLAINKHRFQIIKSLYGLAKEFTFPCYDPIGTKEAVEKQVKLHPDFNVVVAGLNTKASTLGVALSALDNEKIQICYAQALLYNHRNYSRPGDSFFNYSL